MTRHLARLTVLSLLAVGAAAACGGSTAPAKSATVEAPKPPRARFGNLDRGALRQTGADINGDGRPDQFTYSGPSGVVWVERDLDFDGTSDLYEYYGADGTVVEREFNLDFDAAIDAVHAYERGVLVRKDVAVDFGGALSVSKFYDASGNLLRLERDTTGDGRVDYWEFYSEGEVSRVGFDEDGDGRPDEIEAAEK